MSSLNPSAASRYIVMERAASKPINYSYVAVVEVDADLQKEPAMVSLKSKGVRSIVRKWSPTPKGGKTNKSGIVINRLAAQRLATELNTGKATWVPADAYVEEDWATECVW